MNCYPKRGIVLFAKWTVCCTLQSDDNAYAEALLRTTKYQPEFQARGFFDIEQARSWTRQFVPAGSATPAPPSAMPARTSRYWPGATRSTSPRVSANHAAGRAAPATGRPSTS